jgi:hypothetical protein
MTGGLEKEYPFFVLHAGNIAGTRARAIIIPTSDKLTLEHKIVAKIEENAAAHGLRPEQLWEALPAARQRKHAANDAVRVPHPEHYQFPEPIMAICYGCCLPPYVQAHRATLNALKAVRSAGHNSVAMPFMQLDKSNPIDAVLPGMIDAIKIAYNPAKPPRRILIYAPGEHTFPHAVKIADYMVQQYQRKNGNGKH